MPQLSRLVSGVEDKFNDSVLEAASHRQLPPKLASRLDCCRTVPDSTVPTTSVHCFTLLRSHRATVSPLSATELARFNFQKWNEEVRRHSATVLFMTRARAGERKRWANCGYCAGNVRLWISDNRVSGESIMALPTCAYSLQLLEKSVGQFKRSQGRIYHAAITRCPRLTHFRHFY